MLKREKEQVVERLTERIRDADTLIVADYRGLTNAQMEGLRDELIQYGTRFAVVKNTLTRRAAQAAGNDALVALLEGPTAIAFLENDADPVATAKALSKLARDSRVLTIRGGILDGTPVTSDEVESLAALPPADVLRGQVLGAIVAPIQALAGLVAAPLSNLRGLIEARIEQLGGEDGAAPEAPAVEEAPVAEAEAPIAEAEAPIEETSPEAPAAEAEGETTGEDATPPETEETEETDQEEA